MRKLSCCSFNILTLFQDWSNYLGDNKALLEFESFLQCRKIYSQGYNSELSLLSSQLYGYIQNWLENSLSSSPEDLRSLDGVYTPIYIMECPKLHPVPLRWLEGRILDQIEEGLVVG